MNAAVADLYRRIYPIVREKCRRLVGDDAAHDIAQETFLKLLKTTIAHDDVDGLTAWVYRVGTRAAIDWLRGSRLVPAAVDDSRTVEADESRVWSRRTLARLATIVEPALLEVAIVVRVDGLTHAEAGAVLQMSDRTVRRHLLRFDEVLTQEGLRS